MATVSCWLLGNRLACYLAAVNAPALLLLLSALPVLAGSVEPEVDLTELRRLPPVEASNALSTFIIKPGFRLELVASEPLLRSPIEICFDENGRMFVVEMIDYSELRGARPHLGRIRMLEDTDGDGRFDKSTVFVDDLPWPTGVFCANGGVFAAATPDILFLKDTNGDGRADVRQVVFTGFGIDYAPYETNRLNVQAMLNSFRWGLDNRIHGLTSPNGGRVTSTLFSNAAPLNLRGRDFAFDPRVLLLEAEAGGGQYGQCFDDRGRRFTCNNSDHIRVFMYDDRYAARNPLVHLPAPLVSIAADGPAAEVYRRSPEEPWRVIRTRWRVSGAVKGIIEGGGRASGYFTSATGLGIYRGDAWPEEYVGDAFIADCGSNLVHRKKVRDRGVEPVAERPAGEEKTEFLTSTDTWFRPVQIVNAPDGALYVIDMYREIIEHPWSLPPALKKYLDLNAGSDRGRIYRIVPEGFQQPKPPRLGQATTEALVKTLAHRNAWHRETTARLLYERQDRARAVPALDSLLRASQSGLGRMHALHALDGQGALQPSHLLLALADADERVREHAVALAEKFVTTNSPANDPLVKKLASLSGDAAPRVRYQLAWTLDSVPPAARVAPLVAVIQRDAADRWMRAAVLNSLTDGAGEMFAALTPDQVFWGSTSGREFLSELVRLIGAQHRGHDAQAVLRFISQSADPVAAFPLVRALGEGLQRARATLPERELQPVFAKAQQLVADRQAAEASRVQAADLLALTSFEKSGERLLALFVQQEPQALQLAAMTALGKFTDARVGPELLKVWRNLTPRLRDAALGVLLARADRATALLQAVEDGTLRRTDLSTIQVRFLTNHRDARLRAQAARLWAAPAPGKRQAAVDAMMPALQLQGDAAKGRKIFSERCVSCHRLGGEGFMLGPDLTSVRNNGKEKLLISIIDPNREVLPQYIGFDVETKDEESVSGIMAAESATSVTVRQAYGKETVVPREHIAGIRSQGQSLMPEELEAALSPQNFADLLEFVMTAEEVKK